MIKSIFYFLILFILIFNCFQNKDPLNPLIPGWLEKKISLMENNIEYCGTVIYRYEWQSKYYYQIAILISSSIDVYDAVGNKIDWNESNLNDYLHNRKNETIIWRWSQ
jgi:hypothetical protein